MAARRDVHVRLRRSLLGGTGIPVIALLLSSAPADAQNTTASPRASQAVPGPLAPTAAPPPADQSAPAADAPGSSSVEQQAPASTGDDVVVTGSRVITNGYQAPTPVSVLSAQALSAIAPTNVADAVNRLPALSNSVTPRSQPTSITSGAIGVNQLNLRSLGAQRTLVLLDGKRMVNASAVANSLVSYAAPDVNTVPNALVSRVDVVTGGASAVYGSDALSGVVNFVIDHKFTGLKGTVQGGVTTYGDDPSYLVSLAGGTGFADDRGHILASAEYAYNDGIRGSNRPWNTNSAVVLMNPAYTATNGQPFYILSRNVGVSTGTPGGLITTGALRGVVFGPNAAQGIFNFGTVSNNNLMTGGDWQTSRIDNTVDLDSKVGRLSTYGRVSYDIFDNVEFYAEGQYSRTTSDAVATPNRRLNNITISTTNYYFNALPNSAALKAALTAAGQTSFTMGSTNGDIGNVFVSNNRTVTRWTVGLDGKFGVLGTQWSYDGYYQQSRNIVNSSASNVGITANYLLAVDAVAGPTGAPVCRSTLTNPNNGCVPYDVFGTGVTSAAAIRYVTGTAHRRDVLAQDVAAFDVKGQPFSTWAGPAAVAFGVEHRREGLSGVATALDEANAFFTGNYHASTGEYYVTEGFVEGELPLAKDTFFAKSLDLNGAVRETGYTTSGTVTTWKVGATYSPVADIQFRGYHSRDIRAPNVGELFSKGITTSGTAVTDRTPPANTGVGYTANPAPFSLSIGNPQLQPEKSNSNGVGVILSPRFLPGVRGSVDYYSIKITGAIATPGAQTVIDLCQLSNVTSYCQYIQRNAAGTISTVVLVPSNIQSQKTRGLDFDLSYVQPLSSIYSKLNGTFSLHGTANYVISLQTNGTNGITEGAGVLGSYANLAVTALTSPKFRSNLSGTFSTDSFDLTLTWRHVGGGVYSNSFVACVAPNCPTTTVAATTTTATTISGNRIAANDLYDLGIAFRPFAQRKAAELFLAVDNIFNQDPPLIYGVNSDGYYQGQSNFAYDRIGRTFRAGIRFRR